MIKAFFKHFILYLIPITILLIILAVFNNKLFSRGSNEDISAFMFVVFMKGCWGGFIVAVLVSIITYLLIEKFNIIDYEEIDHVYILKLRSQNKFITKNKLLAISFLPYFLIAVLSLTFGVVILSCFYTVGGQMLKSILGALFAYYGSVSIVKLNLCLSYTEICSRCKAVESYEIYKDKGAEYTHSTESKSKDVYGTIGTIYDGNKNKVGNVTGKTDTIYYSRDVSTTVYRYIKKCKCCGIEKEDKTIHRYYGHWK